MTIHMRRATRDQVREYRYRLALVSGLPARDERAWRNKLGERLYSDLTRRAGSAGRSLADFARWHWTAEALLPAGEAACS